MSIGIGYPIDIPQWLATAERLIKANPRSKFLFETTAVELTFASPGLESSRVTGAVLRKSDGSFSLMIHAQGLCE
jgi:hypothetical protein